MLALVKGRYQEIFTDSVSYYSFRPHFSGTTGTLTNLLSNCFFLLYETIMDSVPVNAEEDLKVLYCLLRRFGTNTPKEEWDRVKRIVQRLQSVSHNLPFLQASFYTQYTSLLRRAHAELLAPSSSCTYYKEHEEHQTNEFLKTRAPYAKEIITLGEPLMYIYGPCDYTPAYLDFLDAESIDRAIERLRVVEQIMCF